MGLQTIFEPDRKDTGGDPDQKSIYQEVAEHKDEIVRTLDPNIPDQAEIKLERLDMKRTPGMREGCDLLFNRMEYRVSGNGTPRKLKFFIKRFPDKERPIYVAGIDLEKKFYDLMGDSHVVPSAFQINGVANAILLESSGDRTLDDRLYTNHLTGEEKGKLVKDAVNVLARFDTHAGQKASEILMHLKQYGPLARWLRTRGIKDMEASAKRYFGQKTTQRRNISHMYKPIIRVYTEKEGQQLIHGDAGAQNFVGPPRAEWNTDNIKLVDLASLRFGHVPFDLAQLLTSPGMHYTPEEWNSFLDYTLEETSSPINRSEENNTRARTQFYAALIHEPCKRIIRLRSFRKTEPEHFSEWVRRRPSLKNSESEMGGYVQKALSYVLDNKNTLNFSRDELNSLESFGKYLQKEKVIS